MPVSKFKIYGGKNSFWQYDTDQKLIVLDDNITEVHFSNKNMKHSIIRTVYVHNGERICNVPNVILRLPRNLVVYACKNGATMGEFNFAVIKRPIHGGFAADLENDFGDDTAANAPISTSVTLLANAWFGKSEPYFQSIEIDVVTVNSKIDLLPSSQQIIDLQESDISLIVENDNGTLTCYAIGGKPDKDYTIQALVTEVNYHE